MAVYNIPVSWTRDTSKGYESYDGTIDLNVTVGNDIRGKFSSVAGSGTTKTMPDWHISWNSMEVKLELLQDSDKKYFEYYRDGKFYPNGQNYSYNVALNTDLLSAKVHTMKVYDSTQMFAVGAMTVPNTIALDVTSIKAEKPSNFTKVGSKIYEDIKVKFELVSSNKIDYTVTQNDVVLMSGKDSTVREIIIKAGTLPTKDTVYIKVRSYFVLGGEKHYSEWVTYNLTGLETLIAETPSNVRIIGEERAIEENLIFQWDTGEVKCKANVEVWQDGNKIIEQSSITTKQYILKAGTLKSTNSIRLRVRNTITQAGYTHTSNYTEITINDLKSTTPVVSNLALSGSNRDYVITATVTATNAERYEIYRDTIKIAEGTTNKISIIEGSLVSGKNNLKVIAYRTASAGLLKGEIIKQFDIVQDNPLIYSVEPSSININIDELSKVSFATNTFINRWELFLNGSFFIAGTIGRQVQIDRNIFNKGVNNLKVIADYSPTYNHQEVRQAIKEVTFNGYGKPVVPVLDTTSVYATGTPTFTWTTGTIESDTQVAFEIDVHTENKLVNSTEKAYTMTTALANNQTYLVRLRIKNKFELWSDWVEKEFATSFTELPKPVITLSVQKENVLIVIEGKEIPQFKQMSLYRSIDKVNWLEIANDLNARDNLTDFLVESGTETFYKARVYDKAGGYNESDVKGVAVKLRNYNLLNVQELKSNKQLDFVAINFKNNFTSVTKIFAGASKPTFYKSKSNFLTASMTVKLINEEVNTFVDYLQRGQIFCYRDYKGKKFFVCIDVTAINYINPFMQEVVLNLTEVNFNEKLAGNKGNYTRIIYLDGEYLLDGSIELTSWGGDLS